MWFGNGENMNWYESRSAVSVSLVSLGRSKSCRSEPKRNPVWFGLVRYSVSLVSKFSTEVFGFRLNFRFKLNKIRIF